MVCAAYGFHKNKKTDDDSLSEVLSNVLSFFQKIFFEDRVLSSFYP